MRHAAFVLAGSLALLSSCNGTFRFDVEGADAGDAAALSDAPVRALCLADTDCTVPGLRCHSASGRCVACLDDSDCSAPMARCNLDRHICQQCLTTSDCTATQRCDDTANCLDTCFDDDDTCPSRGTTQLTCDLKLKICVECRSNENCVGNPHGARCDADVGRCVECLGHAQCPSDRPLCDRRRGACVGCIATTDCPAGQACAPVTSTCTVLR